MNGEKPHALRRHGDEREAAPVPVLRDYQVSAVGELRACFGPKKRRRVVLVIPTGGGKTIIASEIIRLSLERGNRVLFVAHRKELLDQTVEKLASFGITDVRTIRGKKDKGNPDAPVIVASIQTLTMPRWMEKLPDVDLVVCDEVHHYKASTYERFVEHYSKAWILGLTATPMRRDGLPLRDIFDDLVIGATMKQLVELGFLVAAQWFSPPRKLGKGQLATTVRESYAELGEGKRCVVFCSTINEAEEVAEDLNEHGISSTAVHGKLPTAEREARLRRLADGEIRVVTNVFVLTEGWDLPSAEVCVLTKIPQAACTFLQMVGRVLRPAPGKTHATVIDLCGAWLVHGLPEADRHYTLDGKEATGEAPTRTCPECYAVFIGGFTSCPMCGAELPRGEKEVVIVNVPLVKVGAKPTASVTITASYPGLCRTCRAAIAAGARITNINGRWVHEGCTEPQAAP